MSTEVKRDVFPSGADWFIAAIYGICVFVFYHFLVVPTVTNQEWYQSIISHQAPFGKVFPMLIGAFGALSVLVRDSHKFGAGALMAVLSVALGTPLLLENLWLLGGFIAGPPLLGSAICWGLHRAQWS